MPDDYPFADIPDIPTLEGRFAFVESTVTRQNLAFCFQYIIFLTIVRSMRTHTGPTSLSLNRDIVVHTASVVESCLHYGVTQLIQRDPAIEAKLTKKWKRANQGSIHTISDDESIVWVRQTRVPHIYSNNPKSEDVNKAALDIELIDDELYGKAEKLRKARNHIHFIGVDKMVSYPSTEAVNSFFEDAGKILKQIETRLTDAQNV